MSETNNASENTPTPLGNWLWEMAGKFPSGASIVMAILLLTMIFALCYGFEVQSILTIVMAFPTYCATLWTFLHLRDMERYHK